VAKRIHPTTSRTAKARRQAALEELRRQAEERGLVIRPMTDAERRRYPPKHRSVAEGRRLFARGQIGEIP
jgi:hypothetical protein